MIPRRPDAVSSRSPRKRWGVVATLVTATMLLTSACTPWVDGRTAGDGSQRAAPSFDSPLPIPPLAESQIIDGVRVFSLTAQEGTTTIKEGLSTPTWGFNGGYLGPTLRASAGEKVAIEFTNELPETTTVHWHGMHLPAEMDGGPHQPVEPGASWRPAWTVKQRAATLWYHPHPHGSTMEHVARGLAGMFILDDDASQASGLPSRYGVDDIPLIVQDVRIRSDGQIELDHQGNEVGLLGDSILTNGQHGAVLEVTTELVRLRLLNASSSRVYDFGFDDQRQFALVGTDGGLLPAPHTTDHVRLSPGERAEIVVPFQAGTEVMLRSWAPDLGDVLVPAAYGGTDEFNILALRAADTLEPSPAVAPAFTALPEWGEDDAETFRSFEVQNREINGRRMDMSRIDERVQVDTTEIWEVTNRDLFPHNWHVHDVQFRIVSIDGAAPPPELSGLKDTIYLEPRRVYRIALRFEDYADDKYPYMIHCHLLLHEDEGLMSQFIVSRKPASRDELRLPNSGHHGSHG